MKKLANECLVFAEKVLKTAELILTDPELKNNIDFPCHQCIEKSFKAFIVLKIGNIPRIHNQLNFYGTVRNYLKLKFKMELFEMINETYIDTKYPSDLGLQPNGLPSIEEAKAFIDLTTTIFNEIKQVIENST